MKPVDALNLLDRAVSLVHGSREAHDQLKLAVGCLRALIDEASQAGKDHLVAAPNNLDK